MRIASCILLFTFIVIKQVTGARLSKTHRPEANAAQVRGREDEIATVQAGTYYGKYSWNKPGEEYEAVYALTINEDMDFEISRYVYAGIDLIAETVTKGHFENGKGTLDSDDRDEQIHSLGIGIDERGAPCLQIGAVEQNILGEDVRVITSLEPSLQGGDTQSVVGGREDEKDVIQEGTYAGKYIWNNTIINYTYAARYKVKIHANMTFEVTRSLYLYSGSWYDGKDLVSEHETTGQFERGQGVFERNYLGAKIMSIDIGNCNGTACPQISIVEQNKMHEDEVVTKALERQKKPSSRKGSLKEAGNKFTRVFSQMPSLPHLPGHGTSKESNASPELQAASTI